MKFQTKISKLILRNWQIAFVMLLLLSFYFPIVGKFFEQDEWHNYGVQIYKLYDQGYLGLFKNIMGSSLPAIQVFNTFNFLVFGVNNWFPAITVLLLVASNSIIWYKNVTKFTGSKSVAFFSLIFGYINLISYQSVTWVLPAVSSQLSFLFLNLSLLTFLNYLKNPRKKGIFLISLLIVLATFTKQNSIFLFALYPTVYLFTKRTEYSAKKMLKLITGIFSVVLIAGILYWNKLGGIKFGDGRVTADWFQLLLNMLFLPLKSMSQLLFPFPDHFYKFTSYLLSVRYGLGFGDPVSQGLLIELISVIISLFLIVGIVMLWKLFKTKEKGGILFFGLFYFFSFLPFTIDKYSTGTGYSESRYYQMAVISLGVVVGIILFRIVKILNLSRLKVSKILLAGLAIFFLASFVYQVKTIQKGMRTSVELTQKRREILEFMNSRVNKESQSLIIYAQSINHTGTDNITGEYFQTGILYPFLVFTHKNNYVSPLFFSDDVLWDFTFQGSETRDKKTVGIFYSYEELKKFISEHPEYKSSLFAIEFDYSNVGKLPSSYNFNDLRIVKYSDITKTVINKLQ